MPELVLKLGDNVIQTYVFDKEVMSIGRSRDNDVVIENLSVSRNHCRVRKQGGKFVLTDLNSANGTYVNGVKITKTEVVDGDVISVGKHRLHFQNRIVPEEQVIADAFGQDRTMLVDRIAQPVLAVTDGKLKGTEFKLTKFETSIGKAQENDIVIGDDWFLSKKQAVIYRRGVQYEIHDFGGFRKTKVNGQPLNEPRVLEAGDVIELGNTRCVFQFAGEPMPTGRVPQEIASDDSIFSSGIGSFAESGAAADSLPRASTEREESSEDYLVVVEGPSGETGPTSEQADAPAQEAAPAPTADAAEEPPVEELSAEVAAMPSEAGVSSSPAEAPEPVAAPGGSSNPRRRKRDRLRELAAAAASPSGTGSSVYGDTQGPASPPEPAPEAASEPAPEPAPESSAPPQNEPENTGPSPIRGRWTGGMTDEEIAANPDLQREVALWEQAIQNRSAVIRRQAAKTLKKLTGRDYEI